MTVEKAQKKELSTRETQERMHKRRLKLLEIRSRSFKESIIHANKLARLYKRNKFMAP